MFKVYHTNIKTRFEICSQLTIKKPERHQWCCYGFFVVNLSTYFTPCFIVSIINFEHVNVGWAPVPNNQMTQKTFTCSRSTLETLEKDFKYVQSSQ